MLNFSRNKTIAIFGICIVGVILAIMAFLPQGSLPSKIPHPRINLGLDLQGGSYLLLEADKAALIKERLDNNRAVIQQGLRSARIPYRNLVARNGTISFQLVEAANADAARTAIKDAIDARSGGPLNLPLFSLVQDGAAFTFSLSDAAVVDAVAHATEQAVTVVRRRIDESGVNEPVVARQGEGRILVELPGVADPKRLKDMLGQTAKMTFRLVVSGQTVADADTDILPIVDLRDGRETGRVAVRKKVEVDGSNLTDAQGTSDDRTREFVVSFTFDSVGARKFADISTRHVNEQFAIVLDDKVLSAPVIREPILGGRGQISGNFPTLQSAADLAVLLRAGALPVPLTVVEERTVGASLGADAIQSGLTSVAIGFVLVVSFMLAAYGRFGVYASIALLANLGLTLAGLSILSATLTLPGIAGLLLALGIAVDSNVLINERTREEVKKGKGVIGSLETGFRRAYTTIVDANLTTLLKMLILFVVGTGAIKGFAITISLGILVSMFTAIELVRLFISRWIKKSRPKELTVGTRLRILPDKTNIPFMKARYSGLIFSALISLASLILVFHPGLKLGVDFAGGVVVVAKAPQDIELATVRQSMNRLDLGPMQVQQFGSPRDIMLKFETQETAAKQQEAVDKVNAELKKIAPGIESSVSSVSASVGAELFHEGMLGLGLAAIAMFIYIAFRFEWPFGVGAVVTMFLDLTKTMGFFALTGMEFNLTSIAAILTIMGFSINDKIVVYDRVRENLRLYKTMPLQKLIDLSINETLARTLFTGITTFLAIAPLALFGGPALWEFGVILLFGLVLATSSSIFIAAPILLNLGEHRLRKTSTQAAESPSMP